MVIHMNQQIKKNLKSFYEKGIYHILSTNYFLFFSSLSM